MKYIRSRVLYIVICLSALFITSCSGNVNNILSGFQSTVSRRVDWNIEQLGRLKSVGLITDNMYKSLTHNMKSRMLELTSTDETNLNKNIKNLIEPALAYVINTSSSPFDGITSADLSNSPMFNSYVDNLGSIDDLLKTNRENSDSSSDKVKPLEILSSKDEASLGSDGKLNQMLKAKIYVLNSELAGVDLSNIAIAMNTIKELKDKNGLTDEEKDRLGKARGYLSYFKETDLSLLGDNESLTRVTSPNTEAYSLATGDTIPDSSSNESLNKPENGKDLVIFSDSVPVMGIRLREIDSTIVDKLLGHLAESKDSYLIDYPDGNQENGARIYRMIYPVNYIDSVAIDNGKTSFTVKESDYIQVNIMTGDVILKNESTLYKQDELSSIQKLYNILGNVDNESSFTVWNKVKTKETQNNKEVEIESNAILLKDYLEYVYLPGFKSEEPFVALGRKIRFYGISKDNTFKDNSAIGKYIDNTGAPVSGAGYLTISELLDKGSGVGNNDKKAIKLQGSYNASSSSSSSSTTSEYSGGTWDNSTGSWRYTASSGKTLDDGWYWIDSDKDGIAECYFFRNSIMVANEEVEGYSVDGNGQWVDANGDVQTKDLGASTSSSNSSTTVSNTSSTGLVSDADKKTFETIEYQDKIYPTIEFPISNGDNSVAGEDGKSNGTNNSRLIHYGIYLDTNLYKSQMYSGWLNIAGDGAGGSGSLSWWNNWLVKAKFSYTIDKKALSEYLGTNLTGDIVKTNDDTVILNIDTISEIQKNLDRQYRIDVITLARTVFAFIGFLCFLYGFLLIAAWALDTSTMLETDFFGILTLKRCVAVIEKTEGLDYGGVLPVTFIGVLIRVFCIVALGVLIINIDFIALIGIVYKTISSLIMYIARGLFGV